MRKSKESSTSKLANKIKKAAADLKKMIDDYRNLNAKKSAKKSKGKTAKKPKAKSAKKRKSSKK